MQKLLKQEEAAKDAIVNFITSDVNGRVAYKQAARAEAAQNNKEEHDRILNKYSSFWKTCILSFEKYLSEIGEPYITIIEIEEDDDDDDDGASENSYTDDREKDKSIPEPAIHWKTSLECFDTAYQTVRDEFLVGSGYEKECNELYRELMKKLRMVQETAFERKIKYKDLHLELLEKALNLQDPNICELLPYLITAYIFNSQHSHFFYRYEARDHEHDDDINMGRFWRIFSDCEIEAIDAVKIRELVNSVAKLFIFDDRSEKQLLKMTLDSDKNSDTSCKSNENIRPVLFEEDLIPQMKGATYIKYDVLLNIIFLRWCSILRQYSEDFKKLNLSNQIDFEKSIDLYNFRMKQDVDMSF